MKTFYICSNNGISAVVTEDTYQAIQAYKRLTGTLAVTTPYPGPIFTFVHDEIYAGRPEWFTGPDSLKEQLLHGHQVVHVPPMDFHVPFSNSLENHSYAPYRMAERKFRTTLAQAIQAFGLVPSGSTVQV